MMNGALNFSCFVSAFRPLASKCWMEEAGGHHGFTLESSQEEGLLLGIAQEKLHNILYCGRGHGMLGSLVGVAVNSGMQTILLQTHRQVL